MTILVGVAGIFNKSETMPIFSLSTIGYAHISPTRIRTMGVAKVWAYPKPNKYRLIYLEGWGGGSKPFLCNIPIFYQMH